MRSPCEPSGSAPRWLDLESLVQPPRMSFFQPSYRNLRPNEDDPLSASFVRLHEGRLDIGPRRYCVPQVVFRRRTVTTAPRCLARQLLRVALPPARLSLGIRERLIADKCRHRYAT